MGLLPCARRDESRRRLFAWCAVALVVGLVACGGGSDDATPNSTTPALSGSAAPAPAIQPGEVPAQLVIGEPRNVDQTPRIAVAWSSEGAFSGSILARIEFGFGFTSLAEFTLQHNGAPAIYQAPSETEDTSPFELRYADGFFVLTALSDTPFGPPGLFGVDIFPSGVTPVPPDRPPCPGNGNEECSNSLGFINNGRWPRVAGDWVSLLIPRDDPAMLVYTVLAKPNPRQDFMPLLERARGQGASMMRSQASQYDFPTATVKVRGCDMPDGTCVDSEERPLESVLVRGVVPIDAAGPAVNAALTLDRASHRLAFKHQPSPGQTPVVLVQQREPDQGRWFTLAVIGNAAPGFGRTLAFSADANTLAVEASPCAVTTVVCSTSSVLVYKADASGTTWSEQARFDGVRAPKMDDQGTRLLGIGVGARADTVAAFELRNGSWAEMPFPALDYTPLDVALSIKGDTLAVARQGTAANPCGCRAVVVYEFVADAAPGWRRTAVLHSKKRLDSVGSMNDDGFGFASATTQSLALSAEGETIAVGASLDSSDAGDTVGDPNNHNAPQSGAIYLFIRQPDSTWAQVAFVKATGAAPLDHFGHTVSLQGGNARLYGGARGLTANAPGVNRNHKQNPALPSPTPGAGGSLNGAAAYAFELTNNGTWVETAKMIAPNADVADFSSFHALSPGGDGTVALATGVRDAAGNVARRIFIY